MTIIYPPEPPDNSPNSERKVRECLLHAQDITALHSVSWQSLRNGKPSDGEADFILLVPKRGILILEVKGGGIDIDNGTWYSTGGDQIRRRIKNPFEQAKDSKYALLNHLQTIDPNLGRIPIVHGVVFPDISVTDSLCMNGPRQLIIDRNDLAAPNAAIENIFLHWNKGYPLSNGEIERIVGILAPTVSVRRYLSDDVADANQALISLTSEQIRVLQSLRRVNRAAIIGGAGTGKTIMAMEKAKQLSECGFSTLLLCYNSPIRLHISTTLAPYNIQVETFHSLTLREARCAKIPTPAEPTNDWYELNASSILKMAASTNNTRYDAILVDEAQDFSLDWLSCVQSLLRQDTSLIYLFADSHQDLYQRGWHVPHNFVEFELSVNCRNTRPIAERVARVFGDILHDLSVDGPEPRFVEVRREDQLIPFVIKMTEALIFDEHMEPDQIVVLTDSTSIMSQLRNMCAAEHLFTTLNGRGVPVETIYRFKGLERDAVILALSDRALLPNPLPLTYVGLSRAKVLLYVIGSQQIRAALGWNS